MHRLLGKKIKTVVVIFVLWLPEKILVVIFILWFSKHLKICMYSHYHQNFPISLKNKTLHRMSQAVTIFLLRISRAEIRCQAGDPKRLKLERL